MPSLSNPTYTALGGKPVALSKTTPAVLVVGKTYSFSVEGPAGSIRVSGSVSDNGSNPYPLYRPSLNWTPSVPDMRLKTLVIGVRDNGVTVTTELFPVRVVQSVDADPLPPQKPDAPALPPLPWGIAGNKDDGVANLTAAALKAKADGGEWLRLWHSHFGKIDDATAAIIDNTYKAGIKVVLCVQPKDGKPYNLGTPDFNKFAAVNADTLRKVEYVVAGNELRCYGIDKYRPDDLGKDWHAPYVRRWLAPMSSALHGIGVKIALASTADMVRVEKYKPDMDALIAAGAPQYIDAVATHLYATADELGNVAPILNMLTIGYGKPVLVDECAPSKVGVTAEEFPSLARRYFAEVRKGRPIAACAYRGLIHPNAKEWPPYLSLFDKNLNPTGTYAAVLSVVA